MDWLPIYDARRPVLEQGWELLAPLLATDQEVDDLLGGRPEPVVEPEVAAGARHDVDLPPGAVMPALADVATATLR